jgi:tetratricopeptide (TPR) repeat protein
MLRGMTPGGLGVEHYANFGSGEPWVARVLLQWQSIVNAVPAFGVTRDEFHLAQGEVFQTLGLAFEALRKLREQVDRRTPVLELNESHASLYGNLWAAYKDRFQRAILTLEPELGFLWDKESKFETAGHAFVEGRPEYASLVELVRSYRANFQNALSTYRNTYLEHRAEADPQTLESFHRLDSAEDTFDKVWRAIEAITASVVVANLPTPLVLLEIPEVHRDPARPERFRIAFT